MSHQRQHLVLHIGRHKTGTTALQFNFVHNQEALANAGIHYPETGRDWVAHHQIAAEVAAIDSASAASEGSGLLTQLLAELRECRKSTILISSEGFQRCDPAVVKRVFKDFDLSVVVYLRDQLSYLQSSYLQAIHAEKFSGSIEEYEESIFYCDYLVFLAAWEQEFSRDNIIARIFSKQFLESGDVIVDFFQAVLDQRLGLPADYHREVLEPAARNTSLKGDAIAFKKRLNTVVGSDHFYFAELYKALGQYSAGFVDPVNLVSRKLARKLKKKYGKSNKKVLKTLSLPPSLLDFPKTGSHQSIPWMGPHEFHETLLRLIEIDGACAVLLEDCYHAGFRCDGDKWIVDFCRNIRNDSLPMIRIRRGQSSRAFPLSASPGTGGYTISRHEFDPEQDQLVLEFNPGSWVEILKKSK